MRTTQDLRQEFDWVDATKVDTSDLFSRIRVGIDTHRIARRRRVAVLSVAAAAILIAVGAIVIPALGNDRPDRGSVATTPSPTSQGDSVTLQPAELGFSLRERPEGYPGERSETTAPGIQELTYYRYEGSFPQLELSIALFDPEASGVGVPVLTDETATVQSGSEGSLTVSFIDAEQIAGASNPMTAVAWQIDNLWLTITSNAPGDQARKDVLDTAALVDVGTVTSFTFPMQVGYVPAGYNITSASRVLDPDGHVAAYLGFDNGPHLGFGSELAVSADTLTNVPDGVVPNTTVGNYEAAFSPGTVESGPHLYVFDVDGFIIEIQGGVANTEAELRQMGVTILVIPGAASDPTVWTTQPLG